MQAQFHFEVCRHFVENPQIHGICRTFVEIPRIQLFLSINLGVRAPIYLGRPLYPKRRFPCFPCCVSSSFSPTTRPAARVTTLTVSRRHSEKKRRATLDPSAERAVFRVGRRPAGGDGRLFDGERGL